MIRAYCSRCNRDLDILPTPICSRDMICRGCFWDLNREEIKAEFEKARKREAEECQNNNNHLTEEKQETLELI